MARKHFRVAQCATGFVGRHAIRAVVAHPLMELVAVKVYTAAKVGLDAGVISGIEPVGIIATDDIARVIAAAPDCVIYAPHLPILDEMCRLLAAGINIVTSRMEFNYRDRIDPEWRQPLEAACAQGGSSLFASGTTPGWSTEIIPLALLTKLRRLDCITLTEFADCSMRPTPEMLFDLLHFGADPATLDPNEPHVTTISTPPSISMTADAVGLTLDDVVCRKEYALTRNRVEILAGSVEVGTIGAMRMIIEGVHKGRVVIRRVTTWYVTKDVEPQWEFGDRGWHYSVEGDVPLDVTIYAPVDSPEHYTSISSGFTANPIVNAVSSVCEVSPGIKHLAELPQILPYFGD